MTAMKAIYIQSALMWNQVAQNKPDVQFIVKIHLNLFSKIYANKHTHTYMHIEVYMRSG